MKRTLCLSITLVALISTLISIVATAQPANENLSNSILLARKKDAALLKQYNWNCRSEIIQDGKVQDIRIDLVSIGPDGELQRSLLNDEPSQLPGLFLRKRLEEMKRKQAEEYLHKLSKQLDDYTLPSAGKVIDFISSAQVKPITSPDGKALLQMTGSNVVMPGDSLTLTVDASTMQTRRVQISTFYKEHAATVTGTFQKAKSGLNHLQYATIEVPDMNVSMQVHNFDYTQND